MCEVTDNAKWSDVFTPEELAAALDIHSLRMAKQYGDYSFAADIAAAAECIRELSERLVNGEAAAIKLQAQVEKAQDAALRIRASMETLGRLPS